ncbi:uncharacterized protein [Coffea arabica]|uniref:Uncharacterized protein isoform X3 n=1 Tax=Coffea arabica TaxID=13443 RepID=A0ABM4VIK2_COFAR
MSSLFHAYFSALLPKACQVVVRSAVCGFSSPSWKRSFQYVGIRAANLEHLLTRIRCQCYSSKSSTTKKKKSEKKSAMKEDREAFFVVRKGDVVGVYKSLSDCQAQVGSSICDPPVSVYKGHAMPKDAEKYLQSCGLKNALYSFKAEDFTEGLFGPLSPCHSYQLPSSSRGETSSELVSKKRPHEAIWSGSGRSCTLEFDGASKGNPGQAGAGVILRADDGSLIQGLWKVKNQNIAILYDEAKKLKDKFMSFQIFHVLRDSNSEADEQANLAVELAEGQIQEEIDK